MVTCWYKENYILRGKLGLIKKFVKSLPTEGDCFKYLAFLFIVQEKVHILSNSSRMKISSGKCRFSVRMLHYHSKTLSITFWEIFKQRLTLKFPETIVEQQNIQLQQILSIAILLPSRKRKLNNFTKLEVNEGTLSEYMECKYNDRLLSEHKSKLSINWTFLEKLKFLLYILAHNLSYNNNILGINKTNTCKNKYVQTFQSNKVLLFSIANFFFFFFSSYNVWKHVRYHILISRHPGVITQFR